MNNPTMEDSIYIQRLKQKIWEKKHPKEIKEPEEQQAEQIDFEKYLKEEKK
jgi:hypothetical protein